MNDFDRIKQVILSEDQLVAMNYVGTGNWKGLVEWGRAYRAPATRPQPSS